MWQHYLPQQRKRHHQPAAAVAATTTIATSCNNSHSFGLNRSPATARVCCAWRLLPTCLCLVSHQRLCCQLAAHWSSSSPSSAKFSHFFNSLPLFILFCRSCKPFMLFLLLLPLFIWCALAWLLIWCCLRLMLDVAATILNKVHRQALLQVCVFVFC